MYAKIKWYNKKVPTHPEIKTNYKWVAVFAIFTLAFVFRFYHIQSTPPGLYPDEAMNGNNALEAIATGDYKVFYTENNGREGLFMNIQAQSIKFLGNTPWALRVVSAVFGFFTVLGVYKLAKRLFNWEIGALAGFFMAVSTWHVIFSRIGFRAIMAPFFMVWGFYYFWKGIQSHKLWSFAISGVFWGLGFYSYISYRIMPLALVLTLLAFWYAIKKDFAHGKYEIARNSLIRGFAMLMVVAILVALPLGAYFYNHPEDFFGRTGDLSIFSSGDPFVTVVVNTVKTLGMFNISGDWNWRHNIAGEPLLFWTVGIFFLIGLVRSFHKCLKTRRTHGHYSSTQVMLLSWFFLGLLPVILSNEGIPHALRAILVIPPTMIFAAEGLWWFYDFVSKDYSKKVAVTALLIFLTGVAVSEYHRYFDVWAKNENTASAFNASYLELGNRLNEMPIAQKKYIVVNAGGTLARGIPVPAQTVMYITDTWTEEKQKNKNIYYLTEKQYAEGQYDESGDIFFLEQ